MVLDEDLQPLHGLTEAGKLEHQRILKAASDHRKAHLLLWMLEKLVGKIWFFSSNDDEVRCYGKFWSCLH